MPRAAVNTIRDIVWAAGWTPLANWVDGRDIMIIPEKDVEGYEPA